MVNWLKVDSSELKVATDERYNRMHAVCMSSMYFPDTRNRLTRLIPQAYHKAKIIVAQRQDGLCDRVDDLEDSQQEQDRKIECNHRASQKALRLGEENRQTSQKALQLGEESLQTAQKAFQKAEEVTSLLHQIQRRDLFADSNCGLPTPSSPSRVQSSPLKPVALGKTLEIGIDTDTTIPTIGGASYTPQPPEGFVKTNFPYGGNRALRDYAKGSSEISKMQRGMAVPTKEINTRICFITTALDVLPNVKEQVYRGATHSTEFVQELARTGVFCDPAFLSTSLGGMHFKFNDCNCRFIITSKTGKYTQPYVGDAFKDENEVMFRPGTSFDITSIKKAACSWRLDGADCFFITMVEQ